MLVTSIFFAVNCIFFLGIVTCAQEKQCFVCRGINCQRTTMQTKIEKCENNLDSCVTIFDKFTVVAKGCLMNIPNELKRKCNDIRNPECQICAGNICNNRGRRDFKCYECDERMNDNTKCATSVNELTPIQCSIPTAPNSYCYTKIYKGFTLRGCSLSVKNQLACLADNDCTLCTVEDGEGCNSKKMAAAGVRKVSSTLALVFLAVSIVLKIC